MVGYLHVNPRRATVFADLRTLNASNPATDYQTNRGHGQDAMDAALESAQF